ncbi:MAG: hypothetical protein ACTSUE_22860 [Promethearchaeota archaeon]
MVKKPTEKQKRNAKKVKLKLKNDNRLIIGIDPGTRNLGISIYDPVTNITRFDLVDLCVMTDPVTKKKVVFKYEEQFMERMVMRFIETYDPYFRRARLVGIEKQKERKYLLVEMMLKIGLNCRYGIGEDANFRAITIDAESHRCYYNIGKKGGWSKNKIESGEFTTSFLSREDSLAAKQLFNEKDKKGNHVDPFEAFTIALFLYREEYHLVNNADKDVTLSCSKTDKDLRENNQVKYIRSFEATVDYKDDIGSRDKKKIAEPSLSNQILTLQRRWEKDERRKVPKLSPRKREKIETEIKVLTRKYLSRQIKQRNRKPKPKGKGKGKKKETSKSKSVLPKKAPLTKPRAPLTKPRAPLIKPRGKLKIASTSGATNKKKKKQNIKIHPNAPWMRNMPKAQRIAILKKASTKTN